MSFWFNLDYFVLVLFAFLVSGLVSSVLYAKGLAGNSVAEMIYFVSSRKTLTQSVRLTVKVAQCYAVINTCYYFVHT